MVPSQVLPPVDPIPMRTIQEALTRLSKGEIGTFFAFKKNPTANEIEMYYDALVHILRTNGLPILPRKQLQRRGSTYPTDHGLDAMQFEMVNAAIYQKLLNTIPSDIPVIRDIINSFGSDQDGYGALYSCMRHFCSHLQDVRRSWGQTWRKEDTAYTYGTHLWQYLDTEQLSGRKFSTREITAEILQQAMRHGQYRLTATFYLQQLTSIINNNDIGEEYQRNRLIMTIE